jgi:bacterial/archaeal transporter family protein
MDVVDALKLALACMTSWGIGSFVAKIAADRIGSKSVVFDLVGYTLALIVYISCTYKYSGLVQTDKLGAFLAFLAGMIGSVGAILFYILLTKRDASSAVPMTALYPVLTAILAFLFLGDKLTWAKGIGIVLSGMALYLLSL